MNRAYWTKNLVDTFVEDSPGPHIVSADLSFSGDFHVGKIRELLIAQYIHSSLQERNIPSRLICYVDDFMPLSKLPSNLPLDETSLGYPICSVKNGETNLLDTYLAGFKENLARLGINPEFISQKERYASGFYKEQVKKVFENHTDFVDLFKELNRCKDVRLIKSDLFGLYCPGCSADLEKSLWPGEGLRYNCPFCSANGSVDIEKGKGMRIHPFIEVPMRLAMDGVTFSAIGSDYFSSGTNREIFEAMFKKFSERNLPYVQDVGSVHFNTKKEGTYSPKIPFSLDDFLSVYELEVLNFVLGHKIPKSPISLFSEVASKNKNKKVEEKALPHDPNTEVLHMYDAFDMNFATRLPKHKGKPFYFPNIVHYLSSHNLDDSGLMAELDLNGCDVKSLEQRIACAKNWLTKYPSSKYDLSFRDYHLDFSPSEQKILVDFADSLKVASSGEEIQNVINEHSRLTDTKTFFDLAYRSLLDRQGGPRLIHVIMKDKEKAINLLEGKL